MFEMASSLVVAAIGFCFVDGGSVDLDVDMDMNMVGYSQSANQPVVDKDRKSVV